METELATNLLTLASIFGETRKLEESTVGRLCAQDARFFSRIRGGKTFTAKKYDGVVLWFSENWPDAVKWPDPISRSVTEKVA